MLDTTLAFLTDRLNDHLQASYPTGEPHVVLSGLCHLDGTVNPGLENKIVLSLVNIEREGASGAAGPQLRPDGDGFARVPAPLNINVYVLVSACFFGNYDQALKLLSAVLGYFQSTPVLTAPTVGAFPRGLEKLTLEIVNLDPHALSNLWSALGAKYAPSMLYKLRMFSIQEG